MRCGEAQRRKGRRRHAGGEARGVENVGSARLVGDGAPWRGNEGGRDAGCRIFAKRRLREESRRRRCRPTSRNVREVEVGRSDETYARESDKGRNVPRRWQTTEPYVLFK